MTSQPWPAPAKINLFLHVLGRRPDGYHRLQTAFQFLELADLLHFQPLDRPAVERPRGPADVPPEQDLCVRAARLLQTETGCNRGARIHVDKRIPMGGGLGGGSSDAATTLVALNRLWDTGLDTGALAALGLRLGADVPVFVRGQAAWGEGVGEELTPIEPATPWYLVVHPGVHVATGAVFGHPELTRNTPPMKIRSLFQGEARNDCEPVVRALYPAVDRALDWLAGFGEARLTGTGACVFAPFSEQARAHAALARLPRQWRGFVVRGLNRSPLLERCPPSTGRRQPDTSPR